MLANCELIGNIGRVPEVRITATGKMATFSLATEMGFGEQKRTQWWNLVAYGKNAETIEQHFKPGVQAYIRGELQQWERDEKRGLSIRVETFKILKFAPREGEGQAGGFNDNHGHGQKGRDSFGRPYPQRQSQQTNNQWDQTQGVPDDDLPF
jgi:single-strand DNA-binding protein